MMAVDLEAY
jgi:hypothetical protein